MDLFNAPVFFLAWSSGGRFYNTVMPAVVVSLAVLLFDKEFYGRIAKRPLLAGVVIAAAAGVWTFGKVAAEAMSKSDSFKFSVLLADPERSTLAQHALPFLRGELHAEKSEGMDVDIGRLDATPSLVSFSDGHPRLQIRTDGGGELARFDVSESLKAAENCRVRVALAVERGRIALGIKTQDSRLLTSEPVAMHPAASERQPKWISAFP